MQLAAEAEGNEQRWQAVPPLASISPLGAPRPGASVLAVTGGPGGTPRALVAVQRFGDGRSMIFTGEAVWRWRMLLPSTDLSYERFWRQAVRWLAHCRIHRIQEGAIFACGLRVLALVAIVGLIGLARQVVAAVANDLAVEDGFRAAENLVAIAIHEHDITEKSVPIRMLLEGLGDVAEDTRAIAIIGI